MADLTVIILTKNEEKNLRKCIKSFKYCAKRFVIVDSFSDDGTKALSEQLKKEIGNKGCELDFYEHRFSTYSNQLNWGIENTNITTEWIMRMDADEELTSELADEIQNKLNNINDDINGVVLRRRTYFMGRWIKHGGRYPEKLLRIIRTGKGKCEEKLMDEHLILFEGNTCEFKHDFIDNNQKNLEWWINKHNWYSNREVLERQMMKDNSVNVELSNKSSFQAKVKRIIKNKGYYSLPKFFRAHLYYFYRYYIKLGFLDGAEGKIFTFLQAYWYRFLVDAKLYECEKHNYKIPSQGDLK